MLQFLLPQRQRAQFMPRPQFGYYPQQNRYAYGDGIQMHNYPAPPPGKGPGLYKKCTELIGQPTTTLSISLLRYINLLRTGRKSIQSKIGLCLQRVPHRQMSMAERLQLRCKMCPSTRLQRASRTMLPTHLPSHQGGECFRG